MTLGAWGESWNILGVPLVGGDRSGFQGSHAIRKGKEKTLSGLGSLRIYADSIPVH